MNRVLTRDSNRVSSVISSFHTLKEAGNIVVPSPSNVSSMSDKAFLFTEYFISVIFSTPQGTPWEQLKGVWTLLCRKPGPEVC